MLKTPDELSGGEMGYFGMALAICDSVLEADEVYRNWPLDKLFEVYLKTAAMNYEPYSGAR